MIKFALLASGSKGNCCLIRNKETAIIIDCGSTKKYLTTCFERLQYDYTSVDALFVTHTHSDHISQLRMFETIKTYSMSDLETSYFNKIYPYDVVSLDTLQVQAIPTSHDAHDSCGYVVKSHHQTLVYMTDTGYVSETTKKHLKNADYYIFESNHDVEMLMETNRPIFIKQRIIGDLGHLCNEDSAQILAELVGENTKEIVLAHISEEGNSQARAKQVLIETFKENRIDYSKIKITSAPQFDIVIGGHKQLRKKHD